MSGLDVNVCHHLLFGMVYLRVLVNVKTSHKLSHGVLILGQTVRGRPVLDRKYRYARLRTVSVSRGLIDLALDRQCRRLVSASRCHAWRTLHLVRETPEHGYNIFKRLYGTWSDG